MTPVVTRRVALAALLALESCAFWIAFPYDAVHTAVTRISILLGSTGRVREFLLFFIIGACLFGWSTLREAMSTSGSGSRFWLSAHTIAAVAFGAIGMSGARMAGNPSWPIVFGIAGAAFLASWIFAFAPPQVYGRWLRRDPVVVAWALAVGLAAIVAAEAIRHWRLFGYATLAIVRLLIPLTGMSAFANPEKLIAGTPDFTLDVTGACSGVEGVGLAFVFLGSYLWGCRRDLRFPAALLLVPIGMAAVFLFNAIRLVAMIVIWHSYGDAVVQGFHSIAGWLSLTFVTFMIILASRRMRMFTIAPTESHSEAGAYLLPLFFILITSLVTQLGFDGIDRLYPLRFIVAAIVLIAVRRELVKYDWKPTWWSVAVGSATFAMWIGVVYLSGGMHGDAAFDIALAQFPAGARTAWLAFRVAGAVITVPMAEELAFRGYLMRKLIDADFAAVDFRRFTWLSFLGSSILFGALHGQWVAGILAGMFFAVAAQRSGRLADAVYAHAIANGLLAVLVLTTRTWSLWT